MIYDPISINFYNSIHHQNYTWPIALTQQTCKGKNTQISQLPKPLKMVQEIVVFIIENI